eukprot:SAG31_NODE_44276_length_263_cov_0.945122_1_plen_39_part_10
MGRTIVAAMVIACSLTAAAAAPLWISPFAEEHGFMPLRS